MLRDIACSLWMGLWHRSQLVYIIILLLLSYIIQTNVRALLPLGLVFGAFVGIVHGQAQLPGVGFPHDYPGKPSGDLSPEWQSCQYLLAVSIQC